MARYIDAVALTDDLLSYAEANKGTYHAEGFKNAVTVVEDQPTADVVERKKGKWETEIRTIHGYKIPFPVCSVCGKYTVDEYIYCPNCGAQMKSE